MNITKNSETGLVFNTSVIFSERIVLIGHFEYEANGGHLNGMYYKPGLETGLCIKLCTGEVFLFGLREGACFELPEDFNDIIEQESSDGELGNTGMPSNFEYFPVEKIDQEIYFDLHDLFYVNQYIDQMD